MNDRDKWINEYVGACNSLEAAAAAFASRYAHEGEGNGLADQILNDDSAEGTDMGWATQNLLRAALNYRWVQLRKDRAVLQADIDELAEAGNRLGVKFPNVN